LLWKPLRDTPRKSQALFINLAHSLLGDCFFFLIEIIVISPALNIMGME
jgi:hypothetical protein